LTTFTGAGSSPFTIVNNINDYVGEPLITFPYQ
jgi:hypothetical protein